MGALRVYLIGPATVEDYSGVVTGLRAAGHDTHFAMAGVELRHQIRELIDCDAVVLMDGWWSDRDGICLQTLAAWLRMKLLDEDGTPQPTTSLRG